MILDPVLRNRMAESIRQMEEERRRQIEAERMRRQMDEERMWRQMEEEQRRQMEEERMRRQMDEEEWMWRGQIRNDMPRSRRLERERNLRMREGPIINNVPKNNAPRNNVQKMKSKEWEEVRKKQYKRIYKNNI